jgi:hypothetical protein
MLTRKLFVVAVVLLLGLAAQSRAELPPFWGYQVRGTVLATARDHFPEADYIVDRWPGEGEEPASVFRVGDPIVMLARVYNSHIEPLEFTVRGHGEFLQAMPGQPWELPPPVSHPVSAAPVTRSVPARWYADFPLELSGVPDAVARGRLDFLVLIAGPHGWQPLFRFPWYLYRVVADPVKPMSPVWTEVLDDACTYAAGASTEADVFDLCTFYLYHSFKLAYTGKRVYYYDEEKSGFWLSRMVDDGRVPGSDALAADCRDTSAYLKLLLKSLGYEAGLLRLFAVPDVVAPFVTNPVCPIGSESSEPANYYSTVWNFHQVSTRVGIGPNRVYDACLAMKWTLTGGPYWNPPRDWPHGGYWQTPNPGVPGRPEAFFGLVERLFGAPAPQLVPMATAPYYLTWVH